MARGWCTVQSDSTVWDVCEHWSFGLLDPSWYRRTKKTRRRPMTTLKLRRGAGNPPCGVFVVLPMPVSISFRAAAGAASRRLPGMTVRILTLALVALACAPTPAEAQAQTMRCVLCLRPTDTTTRRARRRGFEKRREKRAFGFLGVVMSDRGVLRCGCGDRAAFRFKIPGSTTTGRMDPPQQPPPLKHTGSTNRASMPCHLREGRMLFV